MTQNRVTCIPVFNVVLAVVLVGCVAQDVPIVSWQSVIFSERNSATFYCSSNVSFWFLTRSANDYSIVAERYLYGPYEYYGCAGPYEDSQFFGTSVCVHRVDIDYLTGSSFTFKEIEFDDAGTFGCQSKNGEKNEQIRWNISVISSTASTASAGGTATVGSLKPSPSLGNKKGNVSPPSSDISLGEAIGISFGIIFLILAVIVIVVFVMRGRRPIQSSIHSVYLQSEFNSYPPPFSLPSESFRPSMRSPTPSQRVSVSITEQEPQDVRNKHEEQLPPEDSCSEPNFDNISSPANLYENTAPLAQQPISNPSLDESQPETETE